MSNTHMNWGRFAKWFFIRIIFPLSPVIINFLAEYFFHFGTFVFPDDRIIVFCFLLPIIYLQEIEGDVTRNTLYLISFLCLVLYVFAVMGKQPQNIQAFPAALGKIYFVGGIVFGVEVFAAIIYEIVRSFERTE